MNYEYEFFVRSMGDISGIAIEMTSGSNMDSLKDDQTEVLFELVEYDNRKKDFQAANDFARTRLNNFGEILENEIDNNLDVDKANRLTVQLNFHTRNMKEVSEFFSESFGTGLFQQWERIIVRENVDEYKLKLDAIIKIMLILKRKYLDLDIPKEL